jgi:hypothetical protein
VSLISAKKLNDFKVYNASGNIDYTGLRSLLIDNSDNSDNINWIAIANESLANLNYLYLLNLEKTSIINMNELVPFAERKETLNDNLILSGIINVTGSWSEVEKTNY